MSKVCVGHIECPCGHKNEVKYRKPTLITPSISTWACVHCWAKIRSHFKLTPGQQGIVQQDSFIYEPSDKLNRILEFRGKNK